MKKDELTTETPADATPVLVAVKIRTTNGKSN